jgi:hypothetical protein
MVRTVEPVTPTPPKVTADGLKLQAAPVGNPEQLLGAKLTTPAPFTGVNVKTADADCPAGIEVGLAALVTAMLKSGCVTTILTAEDVEEALMPL